MKIHWLGLAVALALIVVLARYGGQFGMVAMLLAIPVLAWFASRVIVHGGFGLWHYARHGSKKDWNGRHYEFGGVRLRAEETDEHLVFVEDDILTVIEQPKSRTLELFGPEERFMLTGTKLTVLSPAGVERLLLKCPHRDAKRLMLFLQREAFYPYAKRHGRHQANIAALPTKTTTVTEEKTP